MKQASFLCPLYKLLKQYRQAFTLAEILIAVSILGIIATFSIPKILTSVQNQQEKAVLKEDLSIISGWLNAGLQDGSLAGINFLYNNTSGYTTSQRALFMLNNVQTCQDSNIPNNCYNAAMNLSGAYSGSSYMMAGIVLHNGSVVWVRDINGDGNGNFRGLMGIDWNGTKGSNTVGQDILLITVGVGPNACSGSPPVSPGAINYGEGTGDDTLYYWVYQ